MSSMQAAVFHHAPGPPVGPQPRPLLHRPGCSLQETGRGFAVSAKAKGEACGGPQEVRVLVAITWVGGVLQCSLIVMHHCVSVPSWVFPIPCSSSAYTVLVCRVMVRSPYRSNLVHQYLHLCHRYGNKFLELPALRARRQCLEREAQALSERCGRRGMALSGQGSPMDTDPPGKPTPAVPGRKMLLRPPPKVPPMPAKLVPPSPSPRRPLVHQQSPQQQQAPPSQRVSLTSSVRRTPLSGGQGSKLWHPSPSPLLLSQHRQGRPQPSDVITPQHQLGGVTASQQKRNKAPPHSHHGRPEGAPPHSHPGRPGGTLSAALFNH